MIKNKPYIDIFPYINIFQNKKIFTLLFLSLLILSIAISNDALAGTTGAEWKPLADKIDNWIGGYLGKVIAVAGGIGIATLGGFKTTALLTGAGVGLTVSMLPTVLGGMVTAIV